MSIQPFRTAVPDDREVLRACLVLGLVFMVGVALAYVWVMTPAQGIPRDGTNMVVGRDFLNFWMYGRAAVGDTPGLWYDLAAYHRELASLLGPDYPGHNWSYPPSVMLLAAPFGQTPYLVALGLWSAISLALFAATMRVHFTDPWLILAMIVSPAAVFCLVSGQSSLVTAAMLVAILGMLDRRPILAGVLIGCLTLKPQLGLLFPVMLIASGRWRPFVVAAATAIAIGLATTALFGVDVWIDFVEKGLPAQNAVLDDPRGIATPFYPTVFMNLRGAGASYALAMAVQAAFAIGAAGLVWWAFRFRRDADPLILMALFLACSIAATPYLLSYDTLALTVAALALLAAGRLDGRGRLIAKLVFWLVLIQMLVGVAHVPGPALVAPAFALYLADRLRSRRAEATGPTASPVAA